MTMSYDWEERLREASDQLEYSLSDEEIERGKELINELMDREGYNDSSYRLSDERRRGWATAIDKLLIRRRGIPIEIENSEMEVNAKLRFLPINPVTRAKNYLDYVIKNLELNWGVRKKVKDILDKIEDMNEYMSKNPLSTLGGAIYLAASLDEGAEVTQREVAGVVNVSEVVVRDRYKELMKSLGIKRKELKIN